MSSSLNTTPLTKPRIMRALVTVATLMRPVMERPMIIRVYGGSALVLASNFRESTLDIDFQANKYRPLGDFLRNYGSQTPETDFVENLGEALRPKLGFGREWLNSKVIGVLSGQFDHHELWHHEHAAFFPKRNPQLDVYVPSVDYLLAMKLRAARIYKDDDFKDLADILHLIDVKGDAIKKPEDLVKIHDKFFRLRQRRTDFDQRITTIWEHHRARPALLAETPCYLGHSRRALQHEP